MNVHTIHPNLGMDEMVDFRLQNSKHYTEQMRFINDLDWTILLCILPIKQLVALPVFIGKLALAANALSGLFLWIILVSMLTMSHGLTKLLELTEKNVHFLWMGEL